MYIYICYDHSRSSRYISTNLGKLKQAKSCQPGLSTSGREDVMEGIISRVVELCWTSFQRILFLHQPRLGQSFCLCHQPWCFFTVFGLMLMMLMLFPPRTLFSAARYWFWLEHDGNAVRFKAWREHWRKMLGTQWCKRVWNIVKPKETQIQKNQKKHWQKGTEI